MSPNEWEERLARDPLGVRLANVAGPSASAEFLRRVLAAPRIATTRRRRARRVLFSLAVAVVATAVLAATPAGPVIGKAILPAPLQQWFGLVAGAPTVITRPPNACSGPSAPPSMVPGQVYWHTCADGLRGGYFTPLYVGLADAQAQVSFEIKTARWLPAGIAFAGVAVFGNDTVDGPSSVSVEYLPLGRTGPGPGIRIQEHPGTQVGGSAAPASAVQHVTVDGQPAVFIRGDYESSGPAANGVWTPGADAEELSWEHVGLTFDLIAGGLHLTQQDLIRLADSVP